MKNPFSASTHIFVCVYGIGWKYYLLSWQFYLEQYTPFLFIVATPPSPMQKKKNPLKQQWQQNQTNSKIVLTSMQE